MLSVSSIFFANTERTVQNQSMNYLGLAVRMSDQNKIVSSGRHVLSDFITEVFLLMDQQTNRQMANNVNILIS